MNRFRKRLQALWRRRQLDRDLEDEMAFHLAMKAEETGDPMGAKRQFGNATALRESCREMWTFTALESWWQDLRYALRTLARNPTVTWVAVAALALGIGANTTVFTVVSSALSFNMGVDHIERLVIITPGEAVRGERFLQSLLDFRDLRSGVHSIDHLAAYRYTRVNVSDPRALPERYSSIQMTASGWALVSRKPLLGRGFTPDDERPAAPPVILLSHRIWQNRYGGDRSIVGKLVRIDEAPRIVIGVMPAGMQFPEDTDLWTPLRPIDLLAGQNQAPPVLFGRLADGVTLAAARSEVDGIAQRLVSRPDGSRGPAADVRPFLEIIGIYEGRLILIAVVCAVGFVLLIVCADVANLLLAQAAVRAREISIRIAIGAGRARIIRQLLIESVLLAIAGGFAGWLVALAGLHWFDVFSANGRRPSWIDFSMNARAFFYLTAISIAAGILFGLAPALRLAKVDVLRARTRGGRLSNLLVVFQMALCVILLAGAGLLIHSSVNLYNVPLVVNPSNVLTMAIGLPEAKYPHRDEQIGFYGRLKTKLASLPGVEVASLASSLPLSGWARFRGEFDGEGPAEASHAPEFGALVVGTEYFRVMQVPLRRGRFFSGGDGVAGSPEAIVNESFAAKFWPGANPLGKRLRRTGGREVQQWLTVIGVVPDVPQTFGHPLQRDPLIYLPYSLEPQGSIFVVARTAVPPATLVEDFCRAVQSLDQDLPAQEVSSLEDLIARQRLNVTAFGALFTIFAAIALGLASLGLYAVIAQAVSRRTQEIGIRMAIGAGRFDIFGLVMIQGMRHIVIGFAAGLPLSFGVTRVLRGLLVGVSPNDPVTFVSVLIVLALAGLLGCAIPARRAIRVEPLVALRCE